MAFSKSFNNILGNYSDCILQEFQQYLRKLLWWHSPRVSTGAVTTKKLSPQTRIRTGVGFCKMKNNHPIRFVVREIENTRKKVTYRKWWTSAWLQAAAGPHEQLWRPISPPKRKVSKTTHWIPSLHHRICDRHFELRFVTVSECGKNALYQLYFHVVVDNVFENTDDHEFFRRQAKNFLIAKIITL